MREHTGIRVEEVTWAEISDYLKACPLAVLPIAASCKEHGLHLPMSTDFIQARWVTQQLIQSHELVVWPTIGYGYYPAFINFPGSVSVTDDTFVQYVAEVCLSIFHHGVRHLVLLNTGISTISPLRSLIEKYEFEGELHLLNLYEGRHFKEMEQRIAQQSAGGHADEVETSIMLAIAPEQVDMKKAEPGLRFGSTRGILQHADSALKNYTKSGVIGDPLLATPEKGGRFIDAIMQDIKDYIANLNN